MKLIMEGWRGYLVESLPAGKNDPGLAEEEWQNTHEATLQQIKQLQIEEEFLSDNGVVTILREINMIKEVSGQASEKNLVNSINEAIKNSGHQSIDFVVGELGKKSIKAAISKGGGQPEPKADVALITTNGESIGISMKKPNFGFFENWVTRPKLEQRLKDAGLPEQAAAMIVDSLVNKLEDMRKNELNPILQKEEYSFIQAVQQFDPNYKYGTPIDGDMLEKLKTLSGTPLAYFKPSEKVMGKWLLPTIVLSMREILGQANYETFLEFMIAGPPSMKPEDKAVAVLTAEVSPHQDEQQIQQILSAVKRADSVIEEYARVSTSDDPTEDVVFRLKTISETRTLYSESNAQRWRGKAGFFHEMPGIRYWVFFQRQKPSF